MTIKNNQLEDAPRLQSKSATDPAVNPNQGSFFTKEVSSVVEGFYVDNEGRIVQLTEHGLIKAPIHGEANTTSNAGSIGEGLALAKTGVDLPFKRIKAGTNITFNVQSSYVEIGASFPIPSGESNTASNVGSSGVGVFRQKTGVNLEFKKIIAGSNVIITDLGNTIQIDSLSGGGGGGSGEANTASNLGTISDGLGLFSSKVGVDLKFKRIKAGTNVTLSDDGNDILISATGGGGGGSGDMLKSVYDSMDNGTVNNSRALNSQAASYYLSRANHTGTQAATTITGLSAVATAGTLVSLSDVNVSSLSNGQFLKWDSATSRWIAASISGGGDMLRSSYDTTNSGSAVDNARALNGQAASFYLSRANHTGTQASSTITGLSAVATSGVYSDLTGRPTLATVATSGSYNDLSSKPSIPTALSALTTDVLISSPSSNQVLQWNGTKWANATLSAGSGDMLKSAYDTTNSGNAVDNSRALNSQTASYYLSRTNHTGTQAATTITGLATVATSGSYNDLSNKPSIPTTLDSLTNVTVPSPTINDVLQWNGTAWVNAVVSGGGGGGGGLSRYVASSTSGEEVWVLATGTGITYSRTGTVGTFVIPAGVQLVSARLRLPMAAIGGTSFTVVYGSGSGNGAGDNTSAADAYRPNLNAWRENDGTAVAIVSSMGTSSFDRIVINSLTNAQTCNVKMVW